MESILINFWKKKTDIDDNIHLKNYSESHFI